MRQVSHLQQIGKVKAKIWEEYSWPSTRKWNKNRDYLSDFKSACIIAHSLLDWLYVNFSVPQDNG